MNIKSRQNRTFLVLTPALVLAASAFMPANAFNVTASAPGVLNGSPSGALVNTFDSPTPIVYGTYTGGSTIVVPPGPATGVDFLVPKDVTTSYFTVQSPSQGGTPPSPATITLPELNSYFGLYIGSLDSYNEISFYNGATLLASYTGTQIAGLTGLTANGSGTDDASNRYVNFTASGPADYFDKITLVSGFPALESDNHAFTASVPEPSNILGLITISALGAGTLLKRKSSSH